MENALGSILPQAIGVAISPVPIIAVILMLFFDWRYTVYFGIRAQAVARTIVSFDVTPPVERPSQRRRRAAHAQMDGDH